MFDQVCVPLMPVATAAFTVHHSKYTVLKSVGFLNQIQKRHLRFHFGMSQIQRKMTEYVVQRSARAVFEDIE